MLMRWAWWMVQVSCKAMISNGTLLAESSERKSLSSECLLIKLCMFRLARIGLVDFEKLEI